jgi:hypothetical protein
MTTIKRTRKKRPYQLRNHWREKKKGREISVTQTGWEGAKAIVSRMECENLSELIERLGRGYIRVEELPLPESVRQEMPPVV